MEHIIGKLLQDFEQGKMTRRQLIQSLALASTAASTAAAIPPAADDSKIIKAVYLNHPGYEVADYRRSRDWYSDLFGLKVVLDDGNKAYLSVGESVLAFHTRKSPTTPIVEHIAFTLADWDEDENFRFRVEAELKRRGLEPSWPVSPPKDHSLFVKDPDGFKVQMGGKNQ